MIKALSKAAALVLCLQLAILPACSAQNTGGTGTRSEDTAAQKLTVGATDEYVRLIGRTYTDRDAT